MKKTEMKEIVQNSFDFYASMDLTKPSYSSVESCRAIQTSLLHHALAEYSCHTSPRSNFL